MADEILEENIKRVDFALNEKENKIKSLELELERVKKMISHGQSSVR